MWARHWHDVKLCATKRIFVDESCLDFKEVPLSHQAANFLFCWLIFRFLNWKVGVVMRPDEMTSIYPSWTLWTNDETNLMTSLVPVEIELNTKDLEFVNEEKLRDTGCLFLLEQAFLSILPRSKFL